MTAPVIRLVGAWDIDPAHSDIEVEAGRTMASASSSDQRSRRRC